MVAGRPPANDPPRKYTEAHELFRLARPAADRGTTAVDEVAAFLEWAVGEGQPGFAVGGIIVVGSLAKGVGRSRNVAAKAIERLVAKGMAVQDKPKSPYRIVARRPIFADAHLVADEQISLTHMIDAVSLFSDLQEVSLDGNDPLAAFLRAELGACGDAMVREAATDWSGGQVQCYERLRTVRSGNERVGVLAEICFMRLAADVAPVFRTHWERLRREGVTRVSLYAVLDQLGEHDVRAGRSRVTVGAPPPWLAGNLAGLAGADAVDLAPFGGDRTLLKWSYGLFHPDTDPMVAFAVCYVRSDRLGIFIRNLDVEQLPD